MIGKRPQPKGGSRKGRPNKLSSSVKEMILGALTDAGGRAYLAAQSGENPAAFMQLVGKVLPLQVTGEGGGPIIIRTGVLRADEDSE